MRKMTVVRDLHWLKESFLPNQVLVKDVEVATLKEEEVAALLRTHVMKERETVTDLMMEDLILCVEEILYVEITTVRNSGLTTMRKMIAVRNHSQSTFDYQLLRDAEVVMMEVKGVVLMRTHAMRVKETVMDQMMEDPMRCAEEILCVVTTTVSNLGLFIMRKMTAVRSLPYLRVGKVGYPGVTVAETVEEGGGKDIDVVMVVNPTVVILHSPRFVLVTYITVVFNSLLQIPRINQDS
jgi:hypothetical protein